MPAPSPDVPGGPISVSRVPPSETYPLRWRVLRPGRPFSAVHLSADDDPDTAAFVARASDGEVVGTTIVYPEPCPWLADRRGAWRLRGMATSDERRNQGVGALVLRAALEHIEAEGGELVWCNARVPAQRFYARAGFRTHGEPWDEPHIGPHIAMWLDLRPVTDPA
jgi:GNAT superfamily N-acetyltransferase